MQVQYKVDKVTFLCDEGDSVTAYEARGVKHEYTHDAGLASLSLGLTHVQHVTMVEGES